MNNKFVALAFTVLILSITIILVLYKWLGNYSQQAEIPILDTFEDKIIYTTDQKADVKLLKSDCAKRGGKFSSCGSICPPGAENCPAVCALVCEIPK